MNSIDRYLYNLKQRQARKRSPERFRTYEQTRYKKDREKRLLLSRILYLKKQLVRLGLETNFIYLPPPYMSNLESIVVKAFAIEFPDTFKKVRPPWLVNPRTGARLELDLYSDLYKIAIEVQGQQHYKRWHHDKTENSFLDRLYRDQLKRAICAKRGVLLLEFRYDDNLKNLIKVVFSFINMV